MSNNHYSAPPKINVIDGYNQSSMVVIYSEYSYINNLNITGSYISSNTQLFNLQNSDVQHISLGDDTYVCPAFSGTLSILKNSKLKNVYRYNRNVTNGKNIIRVSLLTNNIISECEEMDINIASGSSNNVVKWNRSCTIYNSSTYNTNYVGENFSS